MRITICFVPNHGIYRSDKGLSFAIFHVENKTVEESSTYPYQWLERPGKRHWMLAFQVTRISFIQWTGCGQQECLSQYQHGKTWTYYLTFLPYGFGNYQIRNLPIGLK